MINTKDEVVNWFKDLKSYKRIDTMCTLLNMCLPFELRFLGTCLEELGRRDAQELRGIELRVHNPQEFMSDISSCQSGEPTDRKHRRIMALFLALIRACNHTCVNELFRTLEGWGTRDFTRLFDEDVLQELLLVYTMATNHPVFSFEQRMKCGDIFNKLKTCELKPTTGSGSPESANSTPPPPPQQVLAQPPPQTLQQMPPPQMVPAGAAPVHAGGAAAAAAAGTPGGPIPIPGFPQPALAQMIPADGSMPAHVTVEGLAQLQQMHQIPQDFTMPPPSTVPHWTLRNTVFHQVGLDTSFPPPSSSSPHLSNPSSPIQSRTASPTRILPTSSVQHRISRNQQATPVDRPDHRDRESQQQSLKSLDESMLLDQTTALTQLQQLRNGFRPPSHNTLPRQSNKQSYVNQIQYHHQQQQQQQQQQQHQQSGFHGASVGLGSLTHTLNNISLIDLTQKSSSDSGSSTGEISPPETPGLSTAPPPPSIIGGGGGGGGGLIRSRSSNLGRINGRPDKQQQQQQQQLGSSVIYTQTQQQQQVSQQQQQQVQSQQFVGGSNEIMVTSATQNLINSNNNTNTMNTSNGSNSSVVSGAVLIGPPTPTAGGANLVLSSQPQFTPAPYPPYHTAAHLASSRTTLIAAHATPTALPPGSAFRPPTAAYQPMQHNGEILYPYPAGPTIAFLATAAAPIAPGTQNLQQTMRSAAQTTQPPPPQQAQPPPQQPPLIQQQPPPPPQQQQQPPPPQQKVPTAYTPPAAVSGVVPPAVPHPPAASTPTGSLYSPLSCFNCGSQKHTGLECQESSMEDVTRNSIYKLDYLSASAGGTPQPNVGPPSSSSPSLVVSSLPSSAVVVPAANVVVAALSASVSVSRMSLVDTAKSQDAAETSPSPVHHSTSSATATTLPLTPSQQSLVDASTSVSTQTINNQTDSSSSSTISK